MSSIKRFFVGLISLSLFVFSVHAVDLSQMQEDDMVVLKGTVSTIADHNFFLESDFGQIIVEVDDRDNFNEAVWLKEGDQVTVVGRIDQDLFEKKSIEAATIYVPALEFYITANPTDEESRPLYRVFVAEEGDVLTVSGTVHNLGDETFEIQTVYGTFTVEASDVSLPLSERTGLLKIEEGDRVHVTGLFDTGLFNGKVIDATRIVKRYNF